MSLSLQWTPRSLWYGYVRANYRARDAQPTCDQLHRNLFAGLVLDRFKIKHEGPEEYANMWQKSRAIWKYINYHYKDDFDWFVLGGDDLFIIVENLRKVRPCARFPGKHQSATMAKYSSIRDIICLIIVRALGFSNALLQARHILATKRSTYFRTRSSMRPEDWKTEEPIPCTSEGVYACMGKNIEHTTTEGRRTC